MWCQAAVFSFCSLITFFCNLAIDALFLLRCKLNPAITRLVVQLLRMQLMTGLESLDAAIIDLGG